PERLLDATCRLRVAGVDEPIGTIFCGGGTPTILPPDELAALLDALSPTARQNACVEFTVEANPATVDDAKARMLVAGGVTRVSMGAQSFFADELAALERLHTPDDIAPSVATLRRQRVAQINLDLMFGIAGQTLDTWRESLRRAIDLGVDHIACYGLTYEPGTRLTAQRRRGLIQPCDEGLEADMFLLANEVLAAAGFRQYEISNYARPACRCRHNLTYWRNEPYIGVGPSAAGCINGRRYKNLADIPGYIRMIDEHGHAEAESEAVTRDVLINEIIMMQLRLTDGLRVQAFRDRVGVDPIALLAPALDRLVELGKVVVSDTHITLTPAGRLVADAVMTELACAA
ncbi:MAG: radical SAM family heme chaperone HemW, partial [Phycisphaerae bacterium]